MELLAEMRRRFDGESEDDATESSGGSSGSSGSSSDSEDPVLMGDPPTQASIATATNAPIRGVGLAARGRGLLLAGLSHGSDFSSAAPAPASAPRRRASPDREVTLPPQRLGAPVEPPLEVQFTPQLRETSRTSESSSGATGLLEDPSLRLIPRPERRRAPSARRSYLIGAAPPDRRRPDAGATRARPPITAPRRRVPPARPSHNVGEAPARLHRPGSSTTPQLIMVWDSPTCSNGGQHSTSGTTCTTCGASYHVEVSYTRRR